MQKFAKDKGRPMDWAFSTVECNDLSDKKWCPGNQEKADNEGNCGGRANFALQGAFTRVVVHPGRGDFPNGSIRNHDDGQWQKKEHNGCHKCVVFWIDARDDKFHTRR